MKFKTYDRFILNETGIIPTDDAHIKFPTYDEFVKAVRVQWEIQRMRKMILQSGKISIEFLPDTDDYAKKFKSGKSRRRQMFPTLGIIGGQAVAAYVIEIYIDEDNFKKAFKEYPRQVYACLITVLGHELIHTEQFRRSQIASSDSKVKSLMEKMQILDDAAKKHLISVDIRKEYLSDYRENMAWAWTIVTGLLLFGGKKITYELLIGDDTIDKKIEKEKNHDHDDILDRYILFLRYVKKLLDSKEKKMFLKNCAMYYDKLADTEIFKTLA